MSKVSKRKCYPVVRFIRSSNVDSIVVLLIAILIFQFKRLT